jgi:hypothetical protein
VGKIMQLALIGCVGCVSDITIRAGKVVKAKKFGDPRNKRVKMSKVG